VVCLHLRGPRPHRAAGRPEARRGRHHRWIAQTFLQLVLLSIIIVGQNILSAASDKRAEATYNDADAVLHEAVEIQKHLEAQDHAIEQILASVGLSPGAGGTTPPAPPTPRHLPPDRHRPEPSRAGRLHPGHVVEAGLVADERQPLHTRRPVPVLGHDDLAVPWVSVDSGL